MVPAVALEQIATGEQRRMEVESGDAPPGALADVAVERDQERGPAVPLHDPRGHDAYDARMPALASEHEPGVGSGLAVRLHLSERLVEDPLIEGLPLGVEPFEPLGQSLPLRPDRRSAEVGARR